MREVYTGDHLGVPIKSWVKNIESSALDQAINLANLPFAFKHIALMPDCHMGYGMPIGGVLATQDVVVPNAVGVDIGCGMCAVRTSIRPEEMTHEQIKKILGGPKTHKGGIRANIPVGFNRHSKKQDESLMPPSLDGPFFLPVVADHYNAALKQLGTLGGGNHFIEIQKGSDDRVWLMIHSGSRNLGKQVADHYNTVAKKMNARWHSAVPKNWDLAFLPMDTTAGQVYRAEMNYCVDYALANRKLMMKRVEEAVATVFPDAVFEPIINVAHNYAAMEHHFGQNVMVHRKGATRARKDELGIIPGSQGSYSYIVRGKGHNDSFMSCSHGAGRTMSRTRAKKELDLASEIQTLDNFGVVHSMRHANDLDEAPSAYKDIVEVMDHQGDLVDPTHCLQPMAVVKG
jgi:tRNA-splicing ligase RtcB